MLNKLYPNRDVRKYIAEHIAIHHGKGSNINDLQQQRSTAKETKLELLLEPKKFKKYDKRKDLKLRASKKRYLLNETKIVEAKYKYFLRKTRGCEAQSFKEPIFPK